jgi:hypothetical protein
LPEFLESALDVSVPDSAQVNFELLHFGGESLEVIRAGIACQVFTKSEQATRAEIYLEKHCRLSADYSLIESAVWRSEEVWVGYTWTATDINISG